MIVETDLPNDVGLLKRLLLEQKALNSQQTHQMAQLQLQLKQVLTQNSSLQATIEGMQHQLEQLLRSRFGKKSERGKKKPKKPSTKVSSQSDGKKPKRKPLNSALARERTEYTIPDDELDWSYRRKLCIGYNLDSGNICKNYIHTEGN